MSGNSCLSAFVTAPIVSAFSRRPSAVSIVASSAGGSTSLPLPPEGRQLVPAGLLLADAVAALADDQRGVAVRRDLLDVHGDELARLADAIGRGRRLLLMHLRRG